MLIARQTFLRQAVASCDALTLVAALSLSHWIRGPALKSNIGPFSNYFWMMWLIVPAWLMSLWCAGLYRSGTYRSIAKLIAAVVRAQIVAALIMLSSMYMTKSVEVSRVLTQLFIVTSFCAILLQKIFLHVILEQRRRHSSLHRPRVLLVGSTQESARYLEHVDRHASMTTELVGVLTPEDEVSPLPDCPPILGSPFDLPRLLGSPLVIDEVVILTRLWPALTERIAAICAVRGVVLRLMMNLPPASVGAWRADDCGGGVFFLSLTAVPQDVISLTIKRALDVVGGAVGLTMCLAAWLLYGARLKHEAGASTIFRQNRIGQNGRRFVLFKFRTMRRDAEERLTELRARNQMKGPMFKLEDDPRVTATGRRLRSRHLDELPQFWNVLKGEMSLVGTRPPTEDEVRAYETHHHRRLSMKPGLTGPWQLSGNRTINNFEEVVRLDCEYIESWSLRRDLQILMATLKKVVRADAW
jgi:exopolysaccharide biosynthesis polyprenyl glycosylphosphotransferase